MPARVCGFVPGGELDQGVLQRLPDLQQEGFILAQGVVPVLDVVSQGELDHLQRARRRTGEEEQIDNQIDNQTASC